MPTIKEYANSVNSWIDGLKLPTTPVGLYEPIKYMLCGGGKRIRPVLLCAAAEAFGLQCEHARNQAVGLEMFHNFTLLHDDVMDNADVRHGKPTVHRKWNIPTAILSGDTMLTLAHELIGNCADSVSHSVVELFNRTAIEIYEGQQFDMNFETADNVTLDEYIEMIRLKTAVLLGCACKMGAMLAGASDADMDHMYDFGVQMGLAFQLRDDYLDTFGNAEQFGKAIGGDILNDKKTWLRVKADETMRAELAEASHKYSGNDKIAAVKRIYEEAGVDVECSKQTELYTKRAIDSLDKVSTINKDYYQFFADFASMAVDRTY